MSAADAVLGRAGAEGVRRLVSDEAAVVAAATALLEPGASLRAARLHRAKLKPGRKLSAWYSLELRDARGERRRRQLAVTWTLERPPLDAGAVARLETDAAARGLLTPFRRLERWLPKAGMQLLAWPLDPAFPALPALAEARALAALLPAGSPASVAVLRYRPGQRHVLRYDTRGGAVFAKLAAAGTAEPLRRRIGALAGWLAESGGFGAAAPLETPGLPALLYPGLSGAPVALDERSLHAAGCALRLLHAGPRALAGEEHCLADEVRATRRAAEHVDVLLPDAGLRLHGVLDAALELGSALPKGLPALAHGDLKCEHLWRTPAGLALIDLDRHRLGEPAFDLGKLLADLRWRAGADGRAARRGLLAGYGPDEATLARARLYEVVALVRIAARRVRLFEPAWASRTAGLVEAADALLAALAADAGAPAPLPRELVS